MLLVEDDEFQANMMRDMCEHNGFAIDVCVDGADALQRIFDPASAYNLVLLDLVMAPMHGLDILKAIRARDERLTVVIISNSDEKHMVKVPPQSLRSLRPCARLASHLAHAHASPRAASRRARAAVAQACIHHGANSYLVKPVRERDLSNIGQFVLQHRYQSLRLQHLRLNQLQLQQWSAHQLELQRLQADKEKAEAWAVAEREHAEKVLLEKEAHKQQAILQAAMDRDAREVARKEAAMEKERAEMQKQMMHLVYAESHKWGASAAAAAAAAATAADSLRWCRCCPRCRCSCHCR